MTPIFDPSSGVEVEIMYTLEHANEAMRLEVQSEGRHYSLERELSAVPLPASGTVLDVGCGSGVLCRHLQRTRPRLKPHGVDRSHQQIAFARRRSPTIDYETLDILDSEPGVLGRRFDVIVNRYVGHHLGEVNFVRALRWMRSHLAHDGMLVVIDIGGVFVNLATSNAKLREQIRRVASAFPGDLLLAPRIPAILRSEGFSQVTQRTETMHIQGADLDFECQLTEERFTSARPLLEQVLGDELQGFVQGYIDELRRLGITYDKVIATARP